MERILEIGADISTPLGLAGFASALVLLVLRAVIKGNLLPRVTRKVSGQVVLRIINYLFVLALVALVLGGTGWVVRVVADVNDRDPRISGTVYRPDTTLAEGILVAVAGTNASDQTNHNGFFQLDLPRHLAERDTVGLFVGDVARPELHEVPAAEGLLIRLRGEPVATTPGQPIATLPAAVVAQQRLVDGPSVPKQLAPDADALRPASLAGQDVRVIALPEAVDPAERVADRLRDAGAFVTLARSYPIGRTAAAERPTARIVYQSAQEAAARTVRAALEGVIGVRLELAREAAATRTILVYVTGRP